MKCSKKVVMLAVAATMLFGNVLSVFAAPVETDTDWDVTDNKVTFEAKGGNPTDPVDPEDPDEPADPDEDEEIPTGNDGTLRLDLLPQFDFGTQNIKTTGANQIFKAVLPKDVTADEDLPYYVQVTDVRGTGAGWNVTAQMTKQFTDASNHVLTGAKINLKNTAAESQTGTTKPSTVNAGALENTGSPTTVKIASAAANEGMGVTAVRFGDTDRYGDTLTAPDSVELEVPASTQIYASKYSATIRWTLGVTP